VGNVLLVSYVLSNMYVLVFKEAVLFLLTFYTIYIAARRMYVLLYTLQVTAIPSLLIRPLSHIMPSYSYDTEKFFRADNAPEDVVETRKAAFDELRVIWQEKWPKSIEMADYLKASFSDLRFAAANRVFMPFSKILSQALEPCTVVTQTERMDMEDVDGNWLTDVSGSYGVNVCGYDKYKKFIKEGWKRVEKLGCVLGSLHPLVAENIDMLKEISNKDEVSFHMSGTEAVMCAVRVARFNTQKKLVVLFGGAYHGWWDGVQTSAGNERAASDTLTLTDLNPKSLEVIRMRANEIAAVVVNPLQSFHPNKPPPSDLVLVTNSRNAGETTDYATWLNNLKRVCRSAGVVLIFDEVYTGFRLAPGGAQQYFGVDADMVCYGKTLGGGMPVGVVCGPSQMMRRTDKQKPLRVAYVIGTFSAHPLTMGCMNQFLKWVTTDDAVKQYDELAHKVEIWVAETNDKLKEEDMPLRVSSYASVWTMLYQIPGRYHWMLQYYLRDEGVAMSWVGTGRLNFSMDFDDEDLLDVQEKMLKACRRMKADGWWYYDPKTNSNGSIQLGLLSELAHAWWKNKFSPDREEPEKNFKSNRPPRVC